MTGNQRPTRNQQPTPRAAGQTPGLSCRDTVERLPWRLNGSLDDQERRQLDEHLRGCAACRGELAQTLEAARIYSQHVPSLALAEYSQGLEPLELDRELIEGHLNSCRFCREELELARSALQVVDFAAAQAELRARTERRPTPRRWRRLALAASLAAACLAPLLWWVGPAWLDTSPPAGELALQVPHQTLGPGPEDAGLLADGFESGDLSTWSDSLWIAEPEPGESDRPEFFDGFESGDLSTWPRKSG